MAPEVVVFTGSRKRIQEPEVHKIVDNEVIKASHAELAANNAGMVSFRRPGAGKKNPQF
jgi:hypothetical protein